MRRTLFSVAALAIFIAIISPLIMPLAMGAVFGALFYPWQERLERRKLSPYLSSGIVTLGVTVGFLLPAFFIVFMGARLGLEHLGSLNVLKDVSQGGDGSSFFENLVNTLIERPGIRRFFDLLSSYFPIETRDIVQALQDIARTAGLRLGAALGGFLTQLPSLLVSLSVMVVSIYFFLADGARLGGFVRRHSIFPPKQTERVVRTFVLMCRSVILAAVASGLAQGFIFWIACLVAGRSNSMLIAFLIFFASFIPLIGAAPVTLLVALHELLMVGTASGVGLLIVAVAIGMVDNFIRPMVLKGAGDLHPLIAFVAAFGGLQLMGIPGVFLGPVIAGVYVVLIDVLGTKEEQLPPTVPPVA